MKISAFKKHLPIVAKQAGDILLYYYHKKHHIKHKRGAGIVTEADKNSEVHIIKYIKKFFPGSSFLAEESGQATGTGNLIWVIDPLDGTTNYAHGFPYFCVSIAAYEGDTAVAGCIFDPTRGETFFAEKGKGAFLNGDKIRVSKTNQMKNTLLGTGFYYAKGSALKAEVEFFRRLNEQALGVRRPGAAALDLAYVACGRYDGFWERGLSAWDVAAGMLLVEEAKGKVSDYKGKPTKIDSKEVLVSNGLIHRKMIKILWGR